MDGSFDRLRRGQTLVRDAARLLSSDRPLPELLEGLAALLFDTGGASDVTFTFEESDGARTHYRFASPIAPFEFRLSAAIEFGAGVLGSIEAGMPPSARESEDDARTLETIAFQLGPRVAAGRKAENVASLERLAKVDALTGLANRHSFDEALEREWRRCGRSGAVLALAMLDVDFFKLYNDAFGHPAGDACLAEVADAIERCAGRPGDVVARYGGEEFAIVMPECDAAGALQVGRAICDAVRARALPHPRSSLGMVTASVGIAVAVPDPLGEAKSLLRAADVWLYEAKGRGRNRVACDGFVADEPEARAHAALRDNLPQFLTPIVGREREIAELRGLLRNVRLVTIVGMGGLGKTRLAVETVAGAIADSADGVWFVDLAPIADAALLASTVAGAVGFELPVSQEPLAALAGLLKARSMTIVLDNCEHVVGEAARFAESLRAAGSHVRLLATSREPLGVAGETVYRLRPLAGDAAVELFVDRARRADPRFAPDPAALETIAHICRKLDGIALAVELAAARVRLLGPQQLLERLGERFALPSPGGRAALGRHQTMRALIDWSYGLLPESERYAFEQFGTFAGGFTVRAAEAVCAARLNAAQTRAHLQALVDKSLIVANDGGAGRYRMLDSIRAFALDRLNDAGQSDAARLSHARFYAEMAAESERLYGTQPEDEWLSRFEADIDNFRAAFDWAVTHAPSLAATIAGNLNDVWAMLGLHSEGRARTDAAIRALGESGRDRSELLRLWLSEARLSWEARLIDRGLDASDRALAIARRVQDHAAIGEALYLSGRARVVSGRDRPRGLSELAESVTLLRAHGCRPRAARAMSSYGYALSTRQGEIERGSALQHEGLELARGSGYMRVAFAIEIGLAESEFGAGDVRSAVERAREVADLLRGRRWPFELVVTLGNLASYLAVAGEHEEARERANEAIAVAREYRLDARIPPRVQALALAEAVGGDARNAARLLGFVDASYAARGVVRELTEQVVYERLLAVLRERLDPAVLAEELAAGGRLSAGELLRP